MSFRISIRESGDVTVLDLCGKLTIDGESELLSRYLRRLVAKGVRNLLLNLTELTQTDSTGVGVIVGTFVTLKRKDGNLKLLCPHGHVLDVLKVLRLLDVIPSFEDETEAVASFRTQGFAATL